MRWSNKFDTSNRTWVCRKRGELWTWKKYFLLEKFYYANSIWLRTRMLEGEDKQQRNGNSYNLSTWLKKAKKSSQRKLNCCKCKELTGKVDTAAVISAEERHVKLQDSFFTLLVNSHVNWSIIESTIHWYVCITADKVMTRDIRDSDRELRLTSRWMFRNSLSVLACRTKALDPTRHMRFQL